MNIFIVEDNSRFRSILTEMIARIPRASLVGWADDATMAVAAIFKAKPDVLLLDLSLTRSSGLDVLKSVRATAPDTVIYIVTNLSSPGVSRVCLGAGAAAFFDKSLQLDELETTLRALANRTPVAQTKST